MLLPGDILYYLNGPKATSRFDSNWLFVVSVRNQSYDTDAITIYNLGTKFTQDTCFFYDDLNRYFCVYRNGVKLETLKC